MLGQRVLYDLQWLVLVLQLFELALLSALFACAR